MLLKLIRHKSSYFRKVFYMNDLTTSKLDRENILNNSIALKEIETELSTYISGTIWNNQHWFTKEYLAKFFRVDVRTIERTVEANKDELISNGYRVLVGEELASFKLTDINVGQTSRNLAIFSFRSFLNLAMLLQNSSIAKGVRTRILDIVIDVLTEKAGGHRTYINQRDPKFLPAAFITEKARKSFTQALNQYVNMGPYKYEYFTNRIYKCIFLENASTYQKILRLKSKANLRDTMYSEVLTNIAAVETAITNEIEKIFKITSKQLSKDEVDTIIDNISNSPMMNIYFESARRTMATLDKGLRDAYHGNLSEYISSVSSEEYERFLGEKSKSLEEQIREHRDIFLRLKDK